YRPNHQIPVAFQEPFGTTGLLDANFTKKIFLNGTDKTGTVTVTVTSISGDYYSMSFTPDAVGTWVIQVWDSSNSTVKTRFEFDVTDIEDKLPDVLSLANINAEVDTALSDYDAPTKAEMDAGFAALNDIATSDILNSIIEVNGSITLKQAMQILIAVCAGVTASGGLVFKTPDGSTVRVTATVNSSNERTAITLNV
ncbi:hypothetical protein D6827_03405, partial [Candidatus Parcubacteria bacterium]